MQGGGVGHTTARALADGHRELARQLFADLPAGEFDCFDTGLGHVLDRLRTLLGTPSGDGSRDGQAG